MLICAGLIEGADVHSGCMNDIKKINFDSVDKLYNYLNLKLTGLICEEPDWLANLSNAAGVLWLLLEDINWAGFYLYKNEELILGPFQGKPACTHIKIGSGVCGTTAETRETMLIKDVHEFPGHIACDSASSSEIVVPIIKGDRLIGVMDIDSPAMGRFDETDRRYLEKFVSIIVRYVNFPERFV